MSHTITISVQSVYKTLYEFLPYFSINCIKEKKLSRAKLYSAIVMWRNLYSKIIQDSKKQIVDFIVVGRNNVCIPSLSGQLEREDILYRST